MRLIFLVVVVTIVFYGCSTTKVVPAKNNNDIEFAQDASLRQALFEFQECLVTKTENPAVMIKPAAEKVRVLI